MMCVNWLNTCAPGSTFCLDLSIVATIGRQQACMCLHMMLIMLSCMQPDHLPNNEKQRLVRATGAAVGVGASLLETCIPGSGGRLMVFTGGPCTTGPGTVVGLALEESIRTHRVHL